MVTKVHKFELVPQGRFEFTYFDEATAYPKEMKWSFDLPLLWRGKSDFEQVYRDLTAIRRFRAFLKPVSAPVYDLWTSAAYPMGVPASCVERRYYPFDFASYVIDAFNGFADPRLTAFQRLMMGYCMADVRMSTYFRELSLRRTINETYGKYGR
jgi:hypothetical protein